ncbi:MAG: hypothetical protein RBU35_07425 [Anaerolineae bacterium]|nr:hypothetical protein [Anaerolineae bacterium]
MTAGDGRAMQEERLRILKMVQEGQLSAAEAASLLEALAEPAPALPDAGPRAEPGATPDPAARWGRYWIYPLLAGGGLLIAGSLVMGLVNATGGARGWLICGWTPMLLGLLLAVLAWWSRGSTWLHLRIREGGGSRARIALSFPLPLTLAAWALRLAQPFVPQLRDTGVDDLIIALRHSTAEGQPLVVDVQDDETGERVEIYIG